MTDLVVSSIISIANNPGQAQLLGTTEKPVVGGVVSFDDLALDKVGQGYTLVAATPGFPSVISNPFDVSAGSPNPANSTIETATTSPVIADASDTHTIVIILHDEYGNAIEGEVPEFEATGSGNSYGTCSPTDATGMSTCTMTTTVAETKTLAITSPVSKAGSTISFEAGAPSAATSEIEPVGGSTFTVGSTATIQIVLRDEYGNAVVGVVPEFSATGSDNNYGACSATDANGSSTCSLTSSTEEEKTLSITFPVSKDGGTISFVDEDLGTPGADTCGPTTFDAVVFPPSGWTSGGHATWTRTMDNVSEGDASATSGTVGDGEFTWFETTETFGPAGGSIAFDWLVSSEQNYDFLVYCENLSECSSIDYTLRISGVYAPEEWMEVARTLEEGEHTFRWAYVKDGSISQGEDRGWIDNIRIMQNGGGCPQEVDAGNSSVMSPVNEVVANGVTTAEIMIALRDADNQGVAGLIPGFQASGTQNTYGECSVTDANGVSTCTLSSTVAEIKELSITWPTEKAGGNITFIEPLPAFAPASGISVTSATSIPANGISTAEITIVLRDEVGEPIVGEVPEFEATGNGNNYNACSPTDNTGTSICTMTSTEAEVKTLSITSPITKIGGDVTFDEWELIDGCNPYDTPFGGGDGTSGAPFLICSPTQLNQIGTNANRVDKHYKLTADLDFSDSNLTMIGGTTTSSRFSGVFDGNYKVISNIQIDFSFSSYVGLFRRLGSGAQVKNLGVVDSSFRGSQYVGGLVGEMFNASIESSFSTADVSGSSSVGGLVGWSNSSTITESYARGTVQGSSTFSTAGVGGLVGYQSNSSASIRRSYATGLVENSSSTSGGIVGRLLNGGAVEDSYWNKETSGKDTTTGGGVGLTSLEMADESSYAASWSFHPEPNNTWIMSQGMPHLSWEYPQVVDVDVDNSSISGETNIYANGVSTSEITILLLDSDNEGVAGLIPSFEASGAGNTYHSCSKTDHTGLSICSMSSTEIGSQTLSLTRPITKAGSSLEFIAPNVAVPENSTITANADVPANGHSEAGITITLKDAANEPVAAITPTFEASGGGNAYGSCSPSDASGVSLCTMTSTEFGTKTLTIDSPVSASGGTITFTEVVLLNGCDPTLPFGGGDGSAGNPYLICSPDQLNHIGEDANLWSEHFKLSANVDMSGIAFNLIGGQNAGDAFSGSFDGDHFAISNLTLQHESASYVGLFRRTTSTALIQNLMLENVYAQGDSYVAGLVGLNYGSITNSHAEGNLIATFFSQYIGGLVGHNSAGTLEECSTNINIEGGSSFVGGLVGQDNDGIIRDSFATGDVHFDRQMCGGLVGNSSNSTIERSFASGVVSITNGTNQWNSAGGFVGNAGSGTVIEQSFATGDVFGDRLAVGGFAGYLYQATTRDSYATGAVQGGQDYVGGFVGYADQNSIIEQTHAQGQVKGNANANDVGPFAGYSSSNALIENSYFNSDQSCINKGSGTCNSLGEALNASQTGSHANYHASWIFNPSPDYIWTVHQGYPQMWWQFNAVQDVNSVDVTHSSISGETGVLSNGVTTAEIAITLRDSDDQGVANVVPLFEATGSDNIYGPCSPSDEQGVSICTLATHTAEAKTLSITWPISKVGSTIEFDMPPPAVPENSAVTGTTNVPANGQSVAVIYILLMDANNQPVPGQIPTFEASGTGNSYGACTSSNEDGISTCTMTSTVAEAKVLTILTPVYKVDATIHFFEVDYINGCDPFLDFGGGDGSVGDPYLICTTAQFNRIGKDADLLAQNFKLTTNLDFDGETLNMIGNGGWGGLGFSGTFDGNSYTLSNVTLGTVDDSDIGVFRTIDAGGVVKKLGVDTIELLAWSHVGAIAGNNHGTIEDCFARNGNIWGYWSTGGLVGWQTEDGVIERSYATVDVSGDNMIGGLVGDNQGGTIHQSYATGNISSSDSGLAGGLVGWMPGGGIVSESYATGDVTSEGYNVGGLVGYFGATIIDSYATGTVTAAGLVGGLTGDLSGGTIERSYATGNVISTGDWAYVGGLVGEATRYGYIFQSYATGDVFAFNAQGYEQWSVRGLVGSNYGTIIEESFATGNVYGKGSNYGGLVGWQGDFHWSDVDSIVINSYSTGRVVVDGSNAGGLVGRINGGEIHRSYSISEIDGETNFYWLGPLVGRVDEDAIITDMYFNSSVSCVSSGYGKCNEIGNSMTPGEMADKTAYENTMIFEPDTDHVWVMQGGYPLLKWQLLTANDVDMGNSSISGQSSVLADGVSTAEITVVLRDENNQGLHGLFPEFEATGSGNIYGRCGVTNTEGIATCTLASTVAESKELSLSWPISKVGATIEFDGAPAAVVTNSSIEGTTEIPANGVSYSKITISLRDADDNPVAGLVPTFEASGSNNIYDACTTSNLEGISTCKLRSTTVESKTLSLLTPFNVAGNTVNFFEVIPINGCDPYQTFGSGDGTADEPFTICTVEQFNRLSTHGIFLDKYFLLVTDLDFDGQEVKMVGSFSDTALAFFGVFDGNGYKLSNIEIAYPTTDNIGLFRYVGRSATLKNIALYSPQIEGRDFVGSLFARSEGTTMDSDVSGGYIIGRDTVGGLGGRAYNGWVDRVHADIDVNGRHSVGGLVGYNSNFLSDSSSSSVVTATGSSVGGLVGLNNLSGTVQRSYATGTVVGNGAVGGLVGRSTGGGQVGVASTIRESFATGDVQATLAGGGGLVGTKERGLIEHSYATGTVSGQGNGRGGLVGTIGINGSIFESYSNGVVLDAQENAGGLVGQATHGTVIVTRSYAVTETTGDAATDVVGSLFGFIADGVTTNHLYYDSSVACTNLGTGECNSTGTGLEPQEMADPSYYHSSWLFSPSANYTWVMDNDLPRHWWHFSPVNDVNIANSSISGQTGVLANGASQSTITITLLDDNHDGLVGIRPSFRASGSGNRYTKCTITNSSGVSTCALTSTIAGDKDLSISWPIIKEGPTITFE